MARRVLSWGVGLAVAAIAGSAVAADGQGRFAGHGPGVARCGQLLEALGAEGPDRALFVGWVAGFLTATNAYKPTTYDVAPWQPVEFVANVVIDQCGRNADAAVSEIMVAVTEQLAETRMRESSAVVNAEHEGKRVTVYRDVLRQTQTRLKDLGHDPGGADGSFGPRTRSALEAFQRAKGLTVTGLPDDATLLALFYDIVPQQAPGG